MEKQICPGCKTEYLTVIPETCEKCNYPFSANKQEQGRFIGQQIVMKNVSKTTLSILLGLRALFAVAAVVNIGSLFFFCNELNRHHYAYCNQRSMCGGCFSYW